MPMRFWNVADDLIGKGISDLTCSGVFVMEMFFFVISRVQRTSAKMQVAIKHKCRNATPILSLSERAATGIFRLQVGVQDRMRNTQWGLHWSLPLTHTHISRHTNTFDQCYRSLCKKDSSSAKATCCWRALQEAVIETSAHLVLHTQSVILRVTRSAKAWSACKCFK